MEVTKELTWIPEKEVPFNINHNVKVKINPSGYALIRKELERICFPNPEGYIEHAITGNTDADGWTTMQMYDMGHWFGPKMVCGADPPIETEIKIVFPGEHAPAPVPGSGEEPC